MSFSAVVDQKYRLTPADLGGRTRVVMITRVSYQGVETLQPLVHFENIAKPLSLSAEQRFVIAQIARSNVIADWVGVMLELVSSKDETGQPVIEIYPIGERPSNHTARSRPIRASEQSTYVRSQSSKTYPPPQTVAPSTTRVPPIRDQVSPEGPTRNVQRQATQTKDRENNSSVYADESYADQIAPVTRPKREPSQEKATYNAAFFDSPLQPEQEAEGSWLAADLPQVPTWLPFLLGLLLLLALSAVLWLEFA